MLVQLNASPIDMILKVRASDTPLWLVEFYTVLRIQAKEKVSLEINKKCINVLVFNPL